MEKIKHRHPRFGRHKLRVRWGMTPECQADRLDKAQDLLANYADKLDNVVQFDAKTVYLQEKVIYGYVDLAVGYTMSRAAVAKKQGKVIRLKYYGAVNARLGAFFITYYTGTTDMPANRGRLHYKVRSVVEQFGRTLSKHMHDSLPQLCSPLGSAAARAGVQLVHPQPQHRPPLLNCCPCISRVLQLPY
jgi:hypothetical protein